MSERTAEWILDEADKWIEQNPKAWKAIEEAAVDYAARGMRFGIRHICEHVRFEMRTEGFSDGFKMNNSLHPAFARRLINDRPELKKYIETRKSKLDCID